MNEQERIKQLLVDLESDDRASTYLVREQKNRSTSVLHRLNKTEYKNYLITGKCPKSVETSDKPMQASPAHNQETTSKSERFAKWKALLADKYTKPELADLLVANQHRRISNLLAAAYNVKCSTGFIEEDSNLIILEFLRRVIGPGSWIYEVGQQADQNGNPIDKTWDKLMRSLENKSVVEQKAIIAWYYNKNYE